MKFIEEQVNDTDKIKKNIDKLEKTMQSNMNDRLDKMIFSYVESESKFNSEKPHKTNVISIVQVSADEINLYKGDMRILLGGTRLNHAVLVPY